MDYKKLSKEEFDAIITGELTHLAIWLEDEINSIICNYFVGISGKKNEFKKYVLYRDGITFQDKIDILRAIIPSISELSDTLELKSIIKDVEEFKNIRNALAHGLSVSEKETIELEIEVVSRSGKSKIITITPESHTKMYERGEALLTKLTNAREKLIKSFTSRELIELKKLFS